MAKTAFKAHKRHTKIRPYSWDWERPYDPSKFSGTQFPNFDIDFILDRTEGLSPEMQDCPDKSTLLQYAKQTRAQLAEGKWKEAARSAYIVGFFSGRLALSDDASVGKDHRGRIGDQNKGKGYTSKDDELIRPKLERMLQKDSARLNFTYTRARVELAKKAGIGRDRFERLTKDFAIKQGLFVPRPRKKKS